ncbi:hypothetical protein [Methylobacterium terrae]|uniref:hypothetical protein n=1 Tax=Methylobacterium terrae TaxID=2202827 RepID=UPI0013A59145|nr:hypothetical protein [Methylobacterium terrae]
MVDQSEFYAKQRLSANQLKAALAIENAGLLEQAAAMQWVALRTFIFSQLSLRNIRYTSTRKALVLATSDLGLGNFHSDLMFAHLIGTMAEWDENFSINKTQLNLLKCRCENVKRHFECEFKGDQRGV